MKIIYMGTPEFAVPALGSLIDSRHEIVLVVTQPDRAKGRGKKMLPPPVKERAEEAGLRVVQPDKIKGNEEFLDCVRELEPDAIVVAAYGKILPKELLEIPKYGCINIHASLLPRWRGAAPIQHAILAGDEEAGVTIMQMAEGLDTGDMLLKGSVPMETEHGLMYYPTLSDRLSKLGGELIIEALELIEEGRIVPEKQDDSLSTYAGLIKKEDGHIDFSEKTPEEVDRMIRAYEPWPGAYAYLNGEQLKLKAGTCISLADYAELTKDEGDNSSVNPADIIPGTVVKADNSGIYIKAKDGFFCLRELQIPGKNWMDTASYLRGHKLEIGTILE